MKRIAFRDISSFKDLCREIKWFLQRGLYGYAARDTWSLDAYLGTWLPGALREVGRKSGPTSYMYPDAPPDIALKLWREDIEMMARAWEEAAKVCELGDGDKDIMEIGLHSFADNISTLWT